MKRLKLFENFLDDERDFEDKSDEPIVPQQVDYIKQRCELNIDKLMKLLEELQHEFSYIPNVKNHKKNKVEILEILKNAEGMVDAMGMTCLWFNDSYYLYVMPEEVVEEHDYANEESDNEVKAAIDKGEFIVLVMV